MTTFNGESHLAEQLASVLAQLDVGDELIIADDGSVDGTLALIESRVDRRIRVLRQEGRLGVVANFERALRAARGEIIFLCDQDDVWLPNKRKVFVAALAVADLVVSDCSVTDEALNVRVSSFFAQRGSGPGVLRNLWRNSYLGCCMAFRRHLLERALPFPAGIPMHDAWLGLIADASARVRFVPEVTLLYRRHGANLSPTGGRSHFSRRQQLVHRLRYGTGLVVRLLTFSLSARWRGV